MPRLRIFAGPNGSGKSSLFESFSKKYPPGFFLNADLIERELTLNGYIDIGEYGLNLTQDDWKAFLLTDPARSLLQKAADDNYAIDVCIRENVIVDQRRSSHSYEGALVSAFLRFHLLKQKVDFCFETVMSHVSKIAEVTEAREIGYRVYLYFVCIDDPEVNVSRVANRVGKGGHNVSSSKIINRYPNTLKNLLGMIQQAHRCYFFDNASELLLLAEINDGELRLKVDPEQLPSWFVNHVLIHYELR